MECGEKKLMEICSCSLPTMLLGGNRYSMKANEVEYNFQTLAFLVSAIWSYLLKVWISLTCLYVKEFAVRTLGSIVQTVWNWCMYTAISRKIVGKIARDNPERYCGWLWVHSSSKKFKRMAREAIDVCLGVLKESNKSRFDSKSVREQCIDQSPYYLSGLSRAHFLRQPFSK